MTEKMPLAEVTHEEGSTLDLRLWCQGRKSKAGSREMVRCSTFSIPFPSVTALKAHVKHPETPGGRSKEHPVASASPTQHSSRYWVLRHTNLPYCSRRNLLRLKGRPEPGNIAAGRWCPYASLANVHGALRPLHSSTSSDTAKPCPRHLDSFCRTETQRYEVESVCLAQSTSVSLALQPCKHHHLLDDGSP